MLATEGEDGDNDSCRLPVLVGHAQTAVPNDLYRIGWQYHIVARNVRRVVLQLILLGGKMLNLGRNAVLATLPGYQFSGILVYHHILVLKGELKTCCTERQAPFVRAATAHPHGTFGHPLAQLGQRAQQGQLLTLHQLRCLHTEQEGAVVVGNLWFLSQRACHAMTVGRRIEMAEDGYLLPVILQDEGLALFVRECPWHSAPFAAYNLIARGYIIIVTEGLCILFMKNHFPTPVGTILCIQLVSMNEICATSALYRYLHTDILSPCCTVLKFELKFHIL